MRSVSGPAMMRVTVIAVAVTATLLSVSACRDARHASPTGRSSPPIDPATIQALDNGSLADGRQLASPASDPMVRIENIEGWKDFVTSINNSWAEFDGDLPSPDCTVVLGTSGGERIGVTFTNYTAYRSGTEFNGETSAARELTADERGRLDGLAGAHVCSP